MVKSARSLRNPLLALTGHDFVWDGTLGYVAIHLACVGVFWAGEVRQGIAICVGTYLIRAFALSAVYHRYFAHRTFKTSRLLQFLLALLGTLSMQRGPLWWAATHRTHHRYAETPDDLHSPHYQGFWYSHCGWFLDRKNRATDLSKVPDFAHFPELRWLDDWKGHTTLVILHSVLLCWLFGWNGLFWGVCLSSIWILHTTHWIQSMSHSYGGYRRFPTRDKSRNHWLLGLTSLGEFHNNHHYCAASCRQGYVWWEIDICYYLLRAMGRLGLVWDLKDFPQPGPLARKATRVR
jgi:stearoyl-CoA desaturase (Delta-9 desaturase)